MEIVYDLDHEAHKLCEEIGLNMVRAATAGTHPAFIEMIRELIIERLDQTYEHRSVGMHGPRPDLCAVDCCLAKKPE
jgi:ferrochelatase